MQNPHCHFSMDEPIGSFSPVQCDSLSGQEIFSNRVKFVQFAETSCMRIFTVLQ